MACQYVPLFKDADYFTAPRAKPATGFSYCQVDPQYFPTSSMTHSKNDTSPTKQYVPEAPTDKQQLVTGERRRNSRIIRG